MTEQRTSSFCHSSAEPDLMALVNLITPSNAPGSIHLSILPSFLSHLPSSIHTVQISCDLSPQRGGWQWHRAMSSRVSYLNLEWVKNAINKEGIINLHITIKSEDVSVTFLDIEGHVSTVGRDVKSEGDLLPSSGDPYTLTFPFFRENAIFTPLAKYNHQSSRFHRIAGHPKSFFTLPPAATASIIQLSVPPSYVFPCTISCLPVEILSLIFSFSDNAADLSDVCQLWGKLSVPYYPEPNSVVEKYEWLKRYPGAGRLWDRLTFDKSMDVGMVKEVITGMPNGTEVWMDAFWNEEESKLVLNAIEGLQWVDDLTFGRTGSRKWRKEEIENFMWMMGDRIRRLSINDVEDSPTSAPAGLYLSSRLEYLHLYMYPPLPSLSLPHTLQHLYVSNLCPLPPSILKYPLPPHLQHLNIVLAPFSVSGKTSILSTPCDLSHLTHLTHLILDGGEETSNLICPKIFSTLTNAKGIYWITLHYCVVYSVDFPDFISWFFGDSQMRGAEKWDQVDGKEMGYHLEVHLFFGAWREEEIVVAWRTMGEWATSASRWSGVWEA
ncbi:hypothetical protein BT69DRAFT_1296594 [Atractiella rhizophila]|nr:hypothetical protein BT69DRAFT_1296594 [Atractiella rhizophila]